MAEGADACLQTTIAPDRLSASAALVPGIDPAQFEPEMLVRMIAAAGVVGRLIDDQAVRDLLEEYRANPAKGAERVVAQGTAPVDGQDGRLELLPELEEALERQNEARRRNRAVAEGEAQEPPPPAGAEAGGINHYDQSPFCIVKPGQVLGRIHEPVPGADGTDVQGKTLPAKEGKPFRFQEDGSVELRHDGSIVARVCGLLEHAGSLLRVLPTLEIEGNVDFSTGNVRFPGDIVVGRGVRDNFLVESTQNVQVRELVEAAHIRSEQDTTLDRGMAGREKGVLNVGGNLKAKYLDGASAEVAGDCEVAREITNCTVRVEGRVSSPTCAIVGGSVHGARGVEVLQVGTGAGAPTEVVVGRLIALEALAAKAAEMLPAIDARRAKAEARLKQLRSMGGRTSAQQAEEQTELEFEIMSGQSRVQPVLDALARTLATIARATCPELIVHRRLHAKSTLWIGNFRVDITQDLKGPLRIALSESGTPELTDLSAERTVELGTMARVIRDDRFPNLDELRELAKGNTPPAQERRAA